MTTAEEIARLKLSARKTADLINDLIITGKMIDNRFHDSNIYTVRGWIMDEIESRNPKAFEQWIDSDLDDDGLFRFFSVA